MKKKIRLFSTLAILCLSLAVMVVGVFSALTVTHKTKGTISYEIADTYVEIETRIYSTSKKFDDADTLKAKAQEFEASNFAALDALTATGIVEGEGESQVTHDFNKVQLKNLEQGDDYVVQPSDYVDTYSSVTETEAPEDLEVALSYKTAQATDKGVYSYFVVTKLVNKSALPLYVSIPTTGLDAYVAPENNITYKFEETSKTITGLNSELYVVFGMSLDKITVAIDMAEFTYPINVSKDLPAGDVVNFYIDDTVVSKNNIASGTQLSTILEQINTEYNELNICGWYIDEALTQVADLSQQYNGGQLNLYTRTVTQEMLDVLNFSPLYDYDITSLKEQFNIKTLQTSTLTNIASFTISDSVNLSEVVIPKQVDIGGTIYDVVMGTFDTDNTSVTKIVLPTSMIVTPVQYDAYVSGNLVEGATNSTLTYLNLHNNIQEVIDYSLVGYQNLAIDISKMTNLKAIGNYALSGSKITSAVIPEGVTQIGTMAFANCSMLENVEIPTGVTTIEDSTFYGCSSLEAVILPATVESIGSSAFYNCQSMESINIPTGVTTIKASTFYGCSALTSITIPENITKIETNAFNGCQLITEITIPEGIFVLTKDILGNCSSLKDVYLSSTICTIEGNVFSGCSALSDIYYPGTEQQWQENVTVNDTSTEFTNATIHFLGTEENKFVIINNIKYYKQTEDEYIAICMVDKTQTTITLTEQTVSVVDGAFQNCTSVESVTVPENVKSVGDKAFDYMPMLKTINWNVKKLETPLTEQSSLFGSAGVMSSMMGEYVTINIGANVEEVPGYLFDRTSAHSLDVQSVNFLGNKVTKIGPHAFYKLGRITTITVPESVTAVGDEAFYNCNKLQTINWNVKKLETPLTQTSNLFNTFGSSSSEVTVNFGAKVEEVPDYIFGNYDSSTTYTTNVKTVNFLGTKVTRIGDYAFANARSLTTMVIPEGVIYIGSMVFHYCDKLTELTIPSTVKSIGAKAFYRCLNVQTINWNAIKLDTEFASNSDVFYETGYNLAYSNGVTLNIGTSVEEIPAYFFYGSRMNSFTQLKTVNIKNPNLKKIGNYAFGYSRNLSTVKFAGSQTNRNSITIGDGNTYLTNATWTYNSSF